VPVAGPPRGLKHGLDQKGSPKYLRGYRFQSDFRGDSHATASATFLAEPRGTGLGLTYRGTHAACPHYRSRKP
jgi:hypothetical protein